MNKKGVFFTLAVIVIISLFLVTYTFYTEVQKRNAIQKRIETMNNFVFSIEQDLPRQLFASGFRIIFSLENKMIETLAYRTGLESDVQELFYNGTLNGESISIMMGATYSDIQTSLSQKADKTNANVVLSNPTFSITQEDPWNIKAKLTVDMLIEDKNNLSFWNRTSTIEKYIPISNFDDPLYIIETNGIVVKKIEKTPHTIFVQGSDISNLLNHSLSSYYIENNASTSFLDRLKGQTNPSTNGIESIVNLQDLSSRGISVQDKTVVDHIYFSTSNPSACNTLPAGMPSWFKLDSVSLSTYNVSCT